MPREISLLDALVPTLLFVFLLSVFLSWLLDLVFVYCEFYKCIWYRALFRLALFVCVFSTLGLLIY